MFHQTFVKILVPINIAKQTPDYFTKTDIIKAYLLTLCSQLNLKTRLLRYAAYIFSIILRFLQLQQKKQQQLGTPV